MRNGGSEMNKIKKLIVVCKGVSRWEYRETLEDGTENIIEYIDDPYGMAHIGRYTRDPESPHYDPEAIRLWEFFQDYHFVKHVPIVAKWSSNGIVLGNLYEAGTEAKARQNTEEA